jgi:hypothetical protein
MEMNGMPEGAHWKKSRREWMGQMKDGETRNGEGGGTGTAGHMIQDKTSERDVE